MPVLGAFTQTSIERKRYRLDYSDWLNDTELLSAISFQSVPGDLTAASVDAYAIDVDKEHVTFFVSGGVDQNRYKILATADTTFGQRKEDEIVFNVRDY